MTRRRDGEICRAITRAPKTSPPINVRVTKPLKEYEGEYYSLTTASIFGTVDGRYAVISSVPQKLKKAWRRPARPYYQNASISIGSAESLRVPFLREVQNLSRTVRYCSSIAQVRFRGRREQAPVVALRERKLGALLPVSGSAQVGAKSCSQRSARSRA